MIADWLSENNVVASVSGSKTLASRFQSQRASFMPCVAMMYSLSVVESKTISCFFNDQEMAPP